MKRMLSAAAVVLLLSAPSGMSAQLLNKEAPIVVSHYHLNVSSVDAHKKFFVDTLGGTPMTFGADKVEVVKFPDVFVFLKVQKPTGPSRGTAFDHLGFSVPNVPAVVARVKENGFQQTVGREPVPGAPPPAEGQGGSGASIAYILGPDGVKVELVTNRDAGAPPIKHHHVHFINKQYVEMQQWYMKVFNATLRPGQTDFFIGADLPGVGYMLNFFRWEGDQAVTHAPTQGRVMDHVGFEVKNLEAFVKELAAKGITVATPYRKVPGLNNIGTATIVDPWGVSIELTEGMDKVS